MLFMRLRARRRTRKRVDKGKLERIVMSLSVRSMASDWSCYATPTCERCGISQHRERKNTMAHWEGGGAEVVSDKGRKTHFGNT